MMQFVSATALWMLAGLSVLTAQESAERPVRTWTSTEGHKTEAKLLSQEKDHAVLELGDGKTVKVPLTRLSATDQDYVKKNAGPLRNVAPVKERGWPETVEVDSRSIEVKAVQEDAAGKSYIYRSQFFQFTAQDKLAVSVMKEIARTFEATHSLVKALPWGIDPNPPSDLGYYQAKFYTTRRSYILDGGPENSGGVYFSQDRVFRVPFQSLGVELRGKTWFKDDSYRNDTLVHEITHQMMHDFLPYLPIWVIEGTAEYAEMTPYNAGKFLVSSHERGIKEYLKAFENRSITLGSIGSIADLLTMTTDQWHGQANKGSDEQARLYFASALMVYYFNHLDGDAKGSRFLKYMDKIGEARDAWKAFFENPGVKRNADGSYTYPSSLATPEQKRDEEFGREQIAILLEGRTPYQLEADIKAGYKKIGVKW